MSHNNIETLLLAAVQKIAESTQSSNGGSSPEFKTVEQRDSEIGAHLTHQPSSIDDTRVRFSSDGTQAHWHLIAQLCGLSQKKNIFKILDEVNQDDGLVSGWRYCDATQLASAKRDIMLYLVMTEQFDLLLQFTKSYMANGKYIIGSPDDEMMHYIFGSILPIAILQSTQKADHPILKTLKTDRTNIEHNYAQFCTLAFSKSSQYYKATQYHLTRSNAKANPGQEIRIPEIHPHKRMIFALDLAEFQSLKTKYMKVKTKRTANASTENLVATHENPVYKAANIMYNKYHEFTREEQARLNQRVKNSCALKDNEKNSLFEKAAKSKLKHENWTSKWDNKWKDKDNIKLVSLYGAIYSLVSWVANKVNPSSNIKPINLSALTYRTAADFIEEKRRADAKHIPVAQSPAAAIGRPAGNPILPTVSVASRAATSTAMASAMPAAADAVDDLKQPLLSRPDPNGADAVVDEKSAAAATGVGIPVVGSHTSESEMLQAIGPASPPVPGTAMDVHRPVSPAPSTISVVTFSLDNTGDSAPVTKPKPGPSSHATAVFAAAAAEPTVSAPISSSPPAVVAPISSSPDATSADDDFLTRNRHGAEPTAQVKSAASASLVPGLARQRQSWQARGTSASGNDPSGHTPQSGTSSAAAPAAGQQQASTEDDQQQVSPIRGGR